MVSSWACRTILAYLYPPKKKTEKDSFYKKHILKPGKLGLLANAITKVEGDRPCNVKPQ